MRKGWFVRWLPIKIHKNLEDNCFFLSFSKTEKVLLSAVLSSQVSVSGSLVFQFTGYEERMEGWW